MSLLGRTAFLEREVELLLAAIGVGQRQLQLDARIRSSGAAASAASAVCRVATARSLLPTATCALPLIRNASTRSAGVRSGRATMGSTSFSVSRRSRVA